MARVTRTRGARSFVCVRAYKGDNPDGDDEYQIEGEEDEEVEEEEEEEEEEEDEGEGVLRAFFLFKNPWLPGQRRGGACSGP